MKHLPFWHTWEAYGVKHYYVTSYGGRAESTQVRYACKCGKFKTENLYDVGFLPVEHFVKPKKKTT